LKLIWKYVFKHSLMPPEIPISIQDYPAEILFSGT